MKKKKDENISAVEDTSIKFTDEDLNEEIVSEENLENSDESEEIPQQEDKAQEYLEMAQRIQAEFDNYRRRNLELAKNSRDEGIAYAVEALLPVVDSINSAKRQVKDEELLKSLKLIYNQTIACFEKLGVKQIEALNKPFNPDFHNAIMAEEVDGVKSDIVIDEFQEGFELNGKVIRHSVVKVSK